jgi:hypothetical protein
MVKYESEHSRDKLKCEIDAWKAHIERCGLGRRLRFIDWLATSFSARELALVIDSEIDRLELRKTYLRERYGPVG